jgi:O-antigen/teichoic acid export membrane protein
MSADSTLSAAAPYARRRGGLFRRVAGYSAIRGSTEGLLALRGVLLATMLGPAAFGGWALLRMATRYAMLCGLGVFRGMEAEVLHPRAGGPAASRADPGGAALGFMLSVSGALAVVAMLVSLAVPSPDDRLLLRAFAAAVVAESAYAYVLVATRVRTTLQRYAALEAGTAALHLLLGVTLAWSFGLAGAFAALAIASSIAVAVASRWVEFRPVFGSPALRGLLQVGWPLALTGAVGTLLTTADRWVVAAWGGDELLGYYAFAGALASAAAALALSIRTVVFPEVYGDARASGTATALRRHLGRAIMPFATLVPPLLGAVGFCLGPVVALVAPAYGEAVAPARIFLLAGAAVGMVNLAAIGIVAAGEQRQLPLFAGLALAVNLALSIVALLAGAGLEGVAAASLAGHVLFAAAVVRLNAELGGIMRPDGLTVRALRPLVWCGAAVIIGGRAAVALDSEAMGLGIYLVLILPLALRWPGEWRRVRGER